MSRCRVRRWPVRKLLSRGPKLPGLRVWTPSTAWPTEYKANTAGFTLLGAYRQTLTPSIEYLHSLTRIFALTATCRTLIFIININLILIISTHTQKSTVCTLALRQAVICSICRATGLFTTLVFRQSVSYLQMRQLFRASGSVTGCDISSHNCSHCCFTHDNLNFFLGGVIQVFLSLFHQRMKATFHTIEEDEYLCLYVPC